MTCEVVRLRDALRTEAGVLEALQRRSSDVWPAYREQLAVNSDAISLPQSFIHNGCVRVAVADNHAVGFSVVMPADAVVDELDGLFVDPAHMNRGFGRALVEDAARRSIARGARYLEVTAGPARGFYERVAFEVVGSAETRFGPAVRMRRDLRS
jgi:GNAT superfamily N-acetyltransferase